MQQSIELIDRVLAHYPIPAEIYQSLRLELIEAIVIDGKIKNDAIQTNLGQGRMILVRLAASDPRLSHELENWLSNLRREIELLLYPVAATATRDRCSLCDH